MEDSRAPHPAPRPPSAVACDAACVLFAAWTVLCNAVVLLGGTAVDLVWTASIALLAAAVAMSSPLRRAIAAGIADFRDPIVHDSVVWEPSPRLRAAMFAVATAIAIALATRHSLTEFWFLALAFFVVSFALVARSGCSGPAQVHSRASEVALWLLSVGCAVLTLVAHRPDTDDSFYVNMAVSVADFPHLPLLSFDALHGTLGAPFQRTPYRIHSIEILAGLLSHLTGVPALEVSHLWIAALAAMLAPLALARLFRLLDGRRWLWAVVATVIFCVSDGSQHRGYGSFTFVRLFQGKAVFLTAVVPLIMAYGVRFGLAPSIGGLAMLALCQIAALGTNVTAFWAAPAIATLAVACTLSPSMQALKTLALGALSSGYLLAAGLYFKLWAGLGLDAGEAPTGALAAAGPIEQAYDLVLGRGRHLWVPLAIVLLTWPVCRTGLARRFAVVFPLGFFALFGNPWLSDLIVRVTTPTIFWRVLWLLPIPLLAGLLFSAVLEPSARPALRLGRIAAFCALLGAFVALVPSRSSLARARFGWPRPKVTRAHRVAAALIEHLPPHRQALAPLPVSRALPMQSGYSHPLFVKRDYLVQGEEERNERERLTALVAETAPRFERTWFVGALDRYRIEGVVAVVGGGGELADALSQAGFREVAEVGKYAIWTRSLEGR